MFLRARPVLNWLLHWKQSTDGSTALIFSLACIPLFAAGALAIDYSQMVRTRAVLQQALDNATIAAGLGKLQNGENPSEVLSNHLTKN